MSVDQLIEGLFDDHSYDCVGYEEYTEQEFDDVDDVTLLDDVASPGIVQYNYQV